MDEGSESNDDAAEMAVAGRTVSFGAGMGVSVYA